MSVYKKLMEARVRLQNTKLNKSGHNKFAGYKYFELSDFLPSVQCIFHEVGLCGFVTFGNEVASLIIRDTDDPKEIIEIKSPMSTAEMKGCQMVQNLGAVQTYIRRYLWVTALEIVEHDVIGGGNMGEPEKPQLTPNNGKAWGRAINVYLKDGNLDNVKKHMTLTDSDESKLIQDAEVLKASKESEDAVA